MSEIGDGNKEHTHDEQWMMYESVKSLLYTWNWYNC